MKNSLYPLSKEDKKLRNKVEAVVIGCYGIGLILFAITKLPLFVLTTALSVPICFKLFK